MYVQQLIADMLYQRDKGISGNIYWKTQIDFAYNSNKIEGGLLTHGQTRHIFDTGSLEGVAPVDDIIETRNHFKMFDYMLDTVGQGASIARIQAFHRILKNGIIAADDPNLGGWKTRPNEVGDIATAAPHAVQPEMERLVGAYNGYISRSGVVGLVQVLAFHHGFESIHPFFDGNGRVGRMLMFAQCLECGIDPFVVTDDNRLPYIMGLEQWTEDTGPLMEVAQTEQQRYLADVQRLVGISGDGV